MWPMQVIFRDTRGRDLRYCSVYTIPMKGDVIRNLTNDGVEYRVVRIEYDIIRNTPPSTMVPMAIIVSMEG